MINNVVLVGRLTKDIEIRKTSSGLSTATFTLACDRKLSAEQKNNDNAQKADFISCVVWRGSADFLGNYAHKGDTVGVEGRIQTRNYEKNGYTVYVTEILANSVSLLRSKKQENVSESQQTQYSQPTQQQVPQQAESGYYGGYTYEDINSDDLPF